MICFLYVVTLRQIHPVIIFWEAINYYEMRMHQQTLGHYFRKFCQVNNKSHSFVVVSVPEFVENYCLDYLAGRAKPLTIINRIGGRNESNQNVPPPPLPKKPRRRR